MCTLFRTVVSDALPNTFQQTGFGFTFCHLFLKKKNIYIYIYIEGERESFELILQNRKLIWIIDTVQRYLGFWEERLNFGITVAEIQPKVWERRRKMWKEKMLNFGNDDTKFSLSNSAARAWSARSEKEKKKKKLTNELWQCHCRNRGIKFFFSNCGNGIAKNGGKKKLRNLWKSKKKGLCFCPVISDHWTR